MISQSVLQTVELSNSGPTPEQTVLGIALLLTFFGGLVAAGYLIQFVGLTEAQKREKKTFIGQKETQEPQELRFDSSNSPHERLSEVRSLLGGEPPDVEYIGLRGALGTVRDEFGGSWHAYASRVPRLARWLMELAVGLTITAALVHVSTATFERLFKAGGGPMTVDKIVADVLWSIEETVGLATDALGMFPFFDVLWAFGFAYSVQAVQWLYDNPVPIIVLLVGGALATIWLDKRVPNARSVSIRSDRSDIFTVAAAFLLVWSAGALPAAAFGYIGLERVGAIISLLLAVVVGVWLGIKAVRSTISRVRRTVQLLEDESRAAIAYITVRRVGAGAASIAAVLIPVYLLSLLVTGKLAAVIGAYLQGSLEVQVATGLLVLCGIGMAVWAVRDAIPDVRVATKAVMSKSAVRVALFKQGAPVIVMTVVYFLAIGFGLNWVVGVSLAVVAGGVARLAYSAFRRLRYRISNIENPESTPDMVLVQAYQLETSGGDVRYYADVNSVSVAHEDPGHLARVICDVAEDLFEKNETEPSIERAFAEDLLEYGKVDLEETRKSLLTDAKTYGKGWLRKHGGQMDATELDEMVTEQIPESIWRDWVSENRNRGDLRKRNGYYLLN